MNPNIIYGECTDISLVKIHDDTPDRLEVKKGNNKRRAYLIYATI